MYFALIVDYSRASHAGLAILRQLRNHFSRPIAVTDRANQILAESARVITAAPSMMASLMINRPAPERYGNPCVEAPNAGTHASGVVTKNESVVSDIRIRKKLPTAETCGMIGYAAISTPIRTITTPNPWENE